MWLPLAEYSIKHKVSISTLRRKIKAEDIQYRLDDGKYFIMDSEEEHRPSQTSAFSSAEFLAPPAGAERYSDRPLDRSHAAAATTTFEHASARPAEKAKESSEGGESVITAANRLLSDLKKAYTQVLHEKEEQILALKEENADLKTLIKVLESENDRLRGTQP